LNNTRITNSNVTINGDEYVSSGGILKNQAPSTINGNVYAYASGNYSGPGKLTGSIIVNPTLLTQVNADASNASTSAAALPPTQTFPKISIPTTVIGNGGQNVIKINGDITATVILVGSSTDSFVINVAGALKLTGSSTLTVLGGVASANVLYNFVGTSGTNSTSVGNSINGTLLAPTYSFNLDGTINGRVIGGGSSISLLSGAIVNPPKCP
jgi:hypothetical protein